VANIDKNTIICHNHEEHVQHIFNTQNNMKLKTRLNVAKLNIDAVIPHNDEV
jgi:hypothetical protein